MHPSFKQALDAQLIEPALFRDGSPFVLNGKTYYQAKDGGISMLMGRFHAFGDTLKRHDTLKLNEELLVAALTTFGMLFRRIRAQLTLDTEQVLDACGEGLTLLDRLEQRRLLGADISQVYDIASIWYFSEDENPGVVDSEINRKKIIEWTSSDTAGELYDFFLNAPLAQFIPLPALLDTSIQKSMTELNQTSLLDWSITLLRSKMSGASQETISIIESHRATLFAYDTLLTQLSSSTTTTVQPG